MSAALGAYRLLTRALLPLARVYLRRRARRQPAYLEHWDERFEQNAPPLPQGGIWLHAVSVGETRAAAPLVEALGRRFDTLPLVMTQMTPTGRETALQLFADRATVSYLPYDTAANAAHFVERLAPRFGVLMETELWPNLIHACHKRRVPLFLANARLSEKSARGYARIRPLIAPALAALTGIAAQSEADAERLRALGALRVEVLGNTKFDCSPPDGVEAQVSALRALAGPRPVVVLASTREGEEALLLDALPEEFPALVVLVPRHPQRFDAVATLLAERGIAFQRRSDMVPVAATTRVWLGDSMGELFGWYSLADAAFVGGSLLPLGGQNLIEPATVGCPVLIGPSTFNFAAASQAAFAAGAARQVGDAAAVWSGLGALLADAGRRHDMGQAGLAFAGEHRGASQRIVDWIAGHLEGQLIRQGI